MKSDKHNGVRKTLCIIVEQVNEAAEYLRKYDSDRIRVLEVGCWNHLRNVWVGVMTKYLSDLLDNILREELDGVDLWIRVLTSI